VLHCGMPLNDNALVSNENSAAVPPGPQPAFSGRHKSPPGWGVLPEMGAGSVDSALVSR